MLAKVLTNYPLKKMSEVNSLVNGFIEAREYAERQNKRFKENREAAVKFIGEKIHPIFLPYETQFNQNHGDAQVLWNPDANPLVISFRLRLTPENQFYSMGIRTNDPWTRYHLFQSGPGVETVITNFAASEINDGTPENWIRALITHAKAMSDIHQ